MICVPEDRKTCEALLKATGRRGDGAKSLGALVVAVGRLFVGAPYEAHTLEGEGPEELVVNLRAFDCVTFLENALVLAGLIRAGKTAFADYTAALERLRYRRGHCNGYPSRLHYFTDWLFDGERKGLVRDITREIGGVPFSKALRSLTDCRADHPPLADGAVFRWMRIAEGIASRRLLHFIPKAGLRAAEGHIQEGDLIGITTDEPGIDVSHVGIAVRTGQGLRLLHASNAAGRVVLPAETLGRYLAAKPSRTGIIVGRALPGAARAAGPGPAKRPGAPGRT